MIIIIIIIIIHTRTEYKIEKLNSVHKSYQRSYSSLNWSPMLIKLFNMNSVIIIIILLGFVCKKAPGFGLCWHSMHQRATWS